MFKSEKRESARNKARYGMRVTGKNMARTIAQSQAKRLKALNERAAKRKGKAS